MMRSKSSTILVGAINGRIAITGAIEEQRYTHQDVKGGVEGTTMIVTTIPGVEEGPEAGTPTTTKLSSTAQAEGAAVVDEAEARTADIYTNGTSEWV